MKGLRVLSRRGLLIRLRWQTEVIRNVLGEIEELLDENGQIVVDLCVPLYVVFLFLFYDFVVRGCDMPVECASFRFAW